MCLNGIKARIASPSQSNLDTPQRHRSKRFTSICRDASVWRQPNLGRLDLGYALHFKDKQIDGVVAIDARGLLIGGAIARALDVGCIVVRNGSKLPRQKDDNIVVQGKVADHDGPKVLEVRRVLLQGKQRLLLVDDWIGTCAQIRELATLYGYPDDEDAMELARTYDTFAANCLKNYIFLTVEASKT